MTIRTNYLFREDCRKTLQKKITYHYIWTGPPDYSEIDLRPIRDDDKYVDFLSSIFSQFKPKNDLITLFATDRKYRGTIIPRHSILTDVMIDLGYKLITHKIWVKGTKGNLFRQQFSHIITFGTGKQLPEEDRDWGYDGDEFYSDVFFDRPLADKDGQPPALIEKCIRWHTKKKPTVFDPFIGVGNTALAARRCGRYFIGSEVDSEKHKTTKRILKSADIQFFTREGMKR